MMRGLYGVIWIPILDRDSRYRHPKISLVVMDWECGTGLSVCLYGLSVCDPACLLVS